MAALRLGQVARAVREGDAKSTTGGPFSICATGRRRSPPNKPHTRNTGVEPWASPRASSRSTPGPPLREGREQRLRHWKEFVLPLPPAEVGKQGARCMDCGIPFCHNGCPVNNLIPDWNDLVYRDQWREALRVAALDQQLPGVHRPHLPGALRGGLHAEHRRQPGHHQIDRVRDRRSRLGGGLDPAAGAGAPHRQAVAVVGSGPAGLACAQQLARAGHAVTLFEKADRIGGLLRYGIPDFKMEKHLIDRRMSRWRPRASSSAPASRSA
jgi:hypothetical protein